MRYLKFESSALGEKNEAIAHTIHSRWIGQKTAVVLPLKDYEELLEDVHDLAVIAERKDEPTMSFDKLEKRLKDDGLI